MKWFLPVLFFLAFQHAGSQGLNYIHYNANNSKLPHDAIYKLRQDKAGFIWVCTDDGLVRFNGTEMVNFDKGFVSKYVISTDEENGRVWASTWKGGIHYIKNDSAVLLKTLLKASGIVYNTNNIIVFNDLVIVHCFKQCSVFKFDSVQNMLLPYVLDQAPGANYQSYPGEKQYYNFFKSAKHHLYAYNGQGFYEVINNRLKKIPLPVMPDNVWESPSGVLYVLAGACVYSVAADFSSAALVYKLSIEKFRHKILSKFRVLPSGNICLAYEAPELRNAGYAYYFINVHTGYVTDLSKAIGSDVSPADILIDKEGSMWLSTDGRGLYHIFDQEFQQVASGSFFYNSNITNLLRFSRDSLIIATRKGLYLYRNNIVSAVKCPPDTLNSAIRKLFITPEGNIGFLLSSFSYGNKSGYTLIKDKVSMLPYSELYTLRNYILRIPAVGVINLTDRQGIKDYSSRIKGISTVVYSVAEDEKDLLWIATDAGLYYFHPSVGLQVCKEKSLSNILVNCLEYVKGKGLYIGSNNGLFLLPASGPLQHWEVRDGLTNLNVRCLFSENLNSLWLGTQNGLFHFKDNSFSIYKKRDGLIADDVSCFTPLDQSHIAVGSSQGLTVFSPKDARKKTTATLNIETFRVNNEKKHWQAALDLPYKSNIFLKYSVVTFIYPELVYYQYRLNKDEEWITTQNNSLVFTNLKPGNYTLELRAKKYDTGYNSPLVIDFKIQSPWWRSLYFYGLTCFVFIILFFVLFRIRLNRQKEKAFAKYELAELKMKALQAQLNPHFISNALNAIQHFILMRDEVSASDYLGRFADLTRLFLDTSRESLVSIKTELELLNNYLSLEKLRFEDKFDFSIDVHPSIDPVSDYIPGLLVQPFVENSINHGIVYLPKGIKGFVAIKMQKAGDFITITIEDNGIGRTKAGEIKRRLLRSHKSHSGKIVEELTQAYNLLPGCEIKIGVIDRHSGTGEPSGTSVYIKVKISKELISQ